MSGRQVYTTQPVRQAGVHETTSQESRQADVQIGKKRRRAERQAQRQAFIWATTKHTDKQKKCPKAKRFRNNHSQACRKKGEKKRKNRATVDDNYLEIIINKKRQSKINSLQTDLLF